MERKIYRNNRNENKYLEVVHYGCGHYHVVQFTKWENIVNKLGTLTGRRHRWRKANLQDLLEDYHEVEPFEIKLVHKGHIWQHAAA